MKTAPRAVLDRFTILSKLTWQKSPFPLCGHRIFAEFRGIFRQLFQGSVVLIYQLIVIDHLTGTSSVKADRIGHLLLPKQLLHRRIRDRSVELDEQKLTRLFLRKDGQCPAIGMVD